MTGNLLDDRLDREIRSTLAEMWNGSAAAAPTVDEMIYRVGRIAVARPRRALVPAAIVVLGLLLLIVFAVVVVGSRVPARLPAANGPIAVGSKLNLVDPTTGASVPFDGCAACTIVDGDWSSDGSTLVSVNDEDRSALWTWTFGPTEPSRLWMCERPGCVLENPSWSPDGRTIVVEATTSDFAYSAFYVIDRDGRLLHTIQSDAYRAIGWPSWMPDGRILFTAIADDTPAIATMAADGTDIRTILPVRNATAAVSPNGRRIAYVSVDPDPASSMGVAVRLWVFDYDTDGALSVPRLLWQRSNCCISLGYGGPEWSPDGTKIALVAVASPADVPADRDAISLVAVDVTTGSATVLTKASVTRPAWRPAWRPVP